MKKKRIAELYSFLSVASMKRMTDDEKIDFIRLLRQMKPIYVEMNDAVNDAISKVKTELDNQSHIAEFVEKAVADLSAQDAGINIKIMKRDAFERLHQSNDWNFAQIDELEEALVIV